MGTYQRPHDPPCEYPGLSALRSNPGMRFCRRCETPTQMLERVEANSHVLDTEDAGLRIVDWHLRYPDVETPAHHQFADGCVSECTHGSELVTRGIRDALRDRYPILRSERGWRDSLRHAEKLAFGAGWFLTPAPGLNANTRILTADPRRIEKAIGYLLDHIQGRTETVRHYLQHIGVYAVRMPEPVRQMFTRADDRAKKLHDSIGELREVMRST